MVTRVLPEFCMSKHSYNNNHKLYTQRLMENNMFSVSTSYFTVGFFFSYLFFQTGCFLSSLPSLVVGSFDPDYTRPISSCQTRAAAGLLSSPWLLL